LFSLACAVVFFDSVSFEHASAAGVGALSSGVESSPVCTNVDGAAVTHGVTILGFSFSMSSIISNDVPGMWWRNSWMVPTGPSPLMRYSLSSFGVPFLP